jgi:very-short-patch-repair endonuclease
VKKAKLMQKNYNPYNPGNQPFASDLKRNMTKAEACLWKYALKAGKMRGYGFRKQRPVLNYIADFMCIELNLIIEVDGGIHDNEQVLKNINWVIDEIDSWISKHEAEHCITHVPRPRWRPPQPPRGGGNDVE